MQRQIRMANNNIEVVGAEIEGEPGRQTLRGVMNSKDENIVLKWDQLGNTAQVNLTQASDEKPSVPFRLSSLP